MSGGEQQRVALASRCPSGAGLLLADEPTSQLSHDDRDTMVDLIQRVNAEFGTTVVIVTHDPDIAARIPRRITIRNGRIGSEGVHGRDYARHRPGRRGAPARGPGPGLPAGLAGGVRGDRGRVLRPPRRPRAGRREVSTFLAGLRSRRWLNVGVFAARRARDGRRRGDPAVRALLGRAPARPAHGAAPRDRDRAERRDRTPVAAAAGGRTCAGRRAGSRRGRWSPSARRSGTRCSARSPTWSPRTPRTPTGCRRRRTCSPPGSTARAAPATRSTPTGATACARTPTSRGAAPRRPGEALIDPTMLQHDRRAGRRRGHGRLHRLRRRRTSPSQDYPQTYTIVGTYTIDDNASPVLVQPGSHRRRRVAEAAVARLHDPAAGARAAGRPVVDHLQRRHRRGRRPPVDLDALDIATMDDAERPARDLAGLDRRPGSPDPPAGRRDQLRGPVRRGQVRAGAALPGDPGGGRPARSCWRCCCSSSWSPSAAEVRRQEVALAKLRGFSTGKVVRFAVAEPAAVLLLTVPVGITLAVVARNGCWPGSGSARHRSS